MHRTLATIGGLTIGQIVTDPEGTSGSSQSTPISTRSKPKTPRARCFSTPSTTSSPATPIRSGRSVLYPEPRWSSFCRVVRLSPRERGSPLVRSRASGSWHIDQR